MAQRRIIYYAVSRCITEGFTEEINKWGFKDAWGNSLIHKRERSLAERAAKERHGGLKCMVGAGPWLNGRHAEELSGGPQEKWAGI